jgi:hypothetical protein
MVTLNSIVVLTMLLDSFAAMVFVEFPLRK